jgi:hypothetical protein
MDKQIDGKTDRRKDRYMNLHGDLQTGKWTNKEIDRQRNGHTKRWTDG